MSDEEKINIEEQESEPVVPEKETTLEETMEALESEAAGSIEELKNAGSSEISAVQKNDGSNSEVAEMEKVVKEAAGEAEKTKEEYEGEIEGIKDIPNWEDKREEFKEANEAEGAKEERDNEIEKSRGNILNLDDRESTKDFIIEEIDKDEIERIKKGLGSIAELNSIGEKREKLREMAGEILKLSEGESNAFKNSEMKKLVALMNAISDKIDSESNAEIITAEKPQLEKTKVENSTEENVGKTKEFSTREFIQGCYDDFSAKIKEIVKSNQSYSEKFDALDELSNELREQIGFIRKDILETDEAKEILGGLRREFSKAKEDIKKSISEKDLGEEANNNIQNSAKTVENGLKSLELSKETASGKISAIKGISSVFELTVKIYKSIIENDETLKSIVNGKREMLKTAMQKLEKEQAIKDAEAERKGLGEGK